MKKCLYSVNFGGYDNVKEPMMVDGWDYILFTDKDVKYTDWEVRKVNINLPAFMTARYVYINSHKFVPEYDFSLMIGGQMKVDGDLDEFAGQYMDFSKDINIMRHPCRTCVYKEAKIIIREGIDIKKNVDPHMEYYRKKGFPENFGLSACGVIGRQRNRRVEAHERLWWTMVKNWSYRDQLSFDYIRWKFDLCTYNYMPYDIAFGDFFSTYTHGTNRRIYGI